MILHPLPVYQQARLVGVQESDGGKWRDRKDINIFINLIDWLIKRNHFSYTGLQLELTDVLFGKI